MLGGVNGAGKTTIALRLLPEFLGIYDFVNADEIARGLSPLAPSRAQVAAGKLLLRRIDELAQKRISFAFETTCAGRGHLATLKKCKAAGYRINMLYVWLDSPELAIARVALRVQQGGHDVPIDTIRRRYLKSIHNMIDYYLELADHAAVYDNSTAPQTHEGSFIAKKRDGILNILCPERWQKIIDTRLKL